MGWWWTSWTCSHNDKHACRYVSGTWATKCESIAIWCEIWPKTKETTMLQDARGSWACPYRHRKSHDMHHTRLSFVWHHLALPHSIWWHVLLIYHVVRNPHGGGVTLTWRIFSRCLLPGRPMWTVRSNLPGRSNARSRASFLLVAPITRIYTRNKLSIQAMLESTLSAITTFSKNVQIASLLNLMFLVLVISW